MNKATRLHLRQQKAIQMIKIINAIKLLQNEGFPISSQWISALKVLEREYQATFTIWERIKRFLA